MSYSVPGATYIDGEPVSRTVRAQNYATGAHIAQAVSDAEDGTYALDLGESAVAVMVLAFDDYGAEHATSTAYSVGDKVFPATPNAHWYEATVAGTSATSAPIWPTDGSTVTDGGVTWQDMGTMRRPEARGPFIPVEVEA